MNDEYLELITELDNSPLYDSTQMPLSNDIKRRNAQQKIINNEKLSLSDKMQLGRDNTLQKYGEITFKSDHVYRAINTDLLNLYLENGQVIGFDNEDEYIEYEENGMLFNNNRGVDWYLGGISPKYGNIILECPAYKTYFTPASDNGNSMSINPNIKHMKSSGYANPVPIEKITNIYRISKGLNGEEIIEPLNQYIEKTVKNKSK